MRLLLLHNDASSLVVSIQACQDPSMHSLPLATLYKHLFMLCALLLVKIFLQCHGGQVDLDDSQL